MKKATAFLILFSFLGFVNAQSIENQCKTIETVKGNAVSVDPNGNVYVVDGSSLYKLDANGTLLFQYSNLLLGDITSIDVENPLKIMLFYYDESMILFLDEKLSPVGEPLDLMANGYMNVKLATYSTDNSIWIYDPVLQDLINVSFKLKELSRSHLNLPSFEPAEFVSSQEKQLVMYNPSTGLAFFDAFGTYLKTLQLKDMSLWRQVSGHSIFFIREDTEPVEYAQVIASKVLSRQLWAYDFVTMNERLCADLPTSIHPGPAACSANGYYFLDIDTKNLNIIKFSNLATPEK